MKRNAAAVLCVFLFAGCYTQFAYVNRAALEGVPPDSALPADSASAYIRDSVPANPNQVCYWTRDMWGRPQLVCEDADYGRDWYRYNYYPWWNRSDPYFYGSYNSYGWDETLPGVLLLRLFLRRVPVLFRLRGNRQFMVVEFSFGKRQTGGGHGYRASPAVALLRSAGESGNQRHAAQQELIGAIRRFCVRRRFTPAAVKDCGDHRNTPRWFELATSGYPGTSEAAGGG